MAKRQNNGYTVGRHVSGGWWSRVTTGYDAKGNAKRKAFYGATRDEVVKKAQAFRLKRDAGAFVPVNRDVALSLWLDHWLETFVTPNREPKTVGGYSDCIHLHLRPVIGGIQLRKLTSEDVRKLLAAKEKAGLGSYSLLKIRAVLRAALNQAWKEGLIEQNVAAKVTPPKVHTNDPVHLDPKEATYFIESIEGHHLAPFFSFALSTGLRLGEASGLRWEDVDFEQRTVAIRVQLQRIGGKLIHKSLKSTSSRRVLHLSDLAMKALESAKGFQLVETPSNPLDLVFLNSEGRPLDAKYIDKHLKALLVKAGLKPISFHKLRHSAATLMVAAGVELHQVAKHLGHSQISLTANLYAHGVSESQRKAADTLGEVLRRGGL